MSHPVLSWIKLNLSPVIRESIAAAKAKKPDAPWTEDWLAAICCRETGGIIAKRLPYMSITPSGKQLTVVSQITKGDFSQRRGETEKTYHGFGFFQVDIASFPAFVKSGAWMDPRKCCDMAIDILEGKRAYLQPHFPSLTGDDLERAITAAYNSGEGNVRNALNEGKDVDAYTTDHNYSANVWEYRDMYRSL